MTAFLFLFFSLCCVLIAAGFVLEVGKFAMLGCLGLVLLVVLIELLEARRPGRRL